MIAMTLRAALDSYILYHQLAPETINWYCRAVKAFTGWAGGDVPLSEFNGEAISRMLLDKHREGLSAFYVRSLRSALVAILHDVRGGEAERVRSVKTPTLDPHGLTPEEVGRLIAQCAALPLHLRYKCEALLELGYYSGLDPKDIWRMERADIWPGGEIFFRRGKTGAAVFVKIPPELLAMIDAHFPAEGPLLKGFIGRDYFRHIVRRLFCAAGLKGSFKTLRKSSGSLVEQECPGKGCRHLGNSATIFKRHYEVKRLIMSEPTMPPPIPWLKPEDEQRS